MKLSVILPTNRTSLSACARILLACSWGGPDVEVIVRDNSGDPDKADFLSRIKAENCHIEIAPPCLSYENGAEATKLASGDFLLSYSDDDFIDINAIKAVLAAIGKYGDDKSVIGITGDYVVEDSQGTSLFRYPPFDQVNMVDRFKNMMSVWNTNIQFSAVRKPTFVDALQLIKKFPVEFSYHDSIQIMVSMMSGRYINIGRSICYYDNSGWGTRDEVVAKDMVYYRAAGIDLAVMNLHWLFLAFEGTKIILNRAFGGNHTDQNRWEVANIWMSTWHARFSQMPGAPYKGSELDHISLGLREKWRQRQQFDLDELLTDLSGFLGLCNPDLGASYRQFWSGI